MAEKDSITSSLVYVVRPHMGTLLSVGRQLALLGDDLAQLRALSVEARIALFRGIMDPDFVAETTPADLVPTYQLGKRKGRIDEDRYAAAVTEDVHATFPRAAVVGWIREGDWGLKANEASTILRTALLDFVLRESADEPDTRRALCSIVVDELLDVKKDRLVAVIKKALAEDGREKRHEMGEILLDTFKTSEVAACARPAWSFIDTVLVGLATQEDGAPATEANADTSSPPAPTGAAASV